MTRTGLLRRPARWELPPSRWALTPSTSSLSMPAAQIWLRWGLGRRQPGEPPRLMARPRPGLGSEPFLSLTGRGPIPPMSFRWMHEEP